MVWSMLILLGIQLRLLIRFSNRFAFDFDAIAFGFGDPIIDGLGGIFNGWMICTIYDDTLRCLSLYELSYEADDSELDRRRQGWKSGVYRI